MNPALPQWRSPVRPRLKHQIPNPKLQGTPISQASTRGTRSHVGLTIFSSARLRCGVERIAANSHNPYEPAGSFECLMYSAWIRRPKTQNRPTDGSRESRKLQVTNPQTPKGIKLQIGSRSLHPLELDYWSFPGGWGLVLGTSGCATRAAGWACRYILAMKR